jgi:hypothetical protein
MPFVPVADTVQVQTIFELDGQIVENTSYWFKVGGWTEGDISDHLAALKTFIVSDLMPLLSSAIQLVRMIGILLDTAESIGVVLNVSPPVVGSDASGALPNNVTYTVTFLTAGRGRANRGRNYIPGISVNATDGANIISNDFRLAIVDFYEGLRLVGASSGAVMGVVSRFSGVDSAGRPIPRTVGAVTAITGFTTFDAVLDSQRRRLPGRGQ